MPSEFLKDYLRETHNIFNGLNTKEFEILIEELVGAYERGSQIFICGNGGSASTASHFACDLNKGVSFGMGKRYKIMCLNDNIPTMLAYANDTSYNDVFVEQLKNFMNKDDLVIGVSGSGNSENVVRVIRYGNDYGGRTFAICGFGGGRLKNIAKNSIVIKSNDMQKVEDLHLIVFHCAMQYLHKSITANNK